MDIKNEKINNVAVISLTGELDYNTYKDFNRAAAAVIEKKLADRIAVVMSDVSHIDSMGLGTITKLWKSADASGMEFSLVNVPKNIAGMIKLVNLDKRIKVYDSVEEAAG
ncbi:MAG TPA: STAS domain-containing protein [bacterium]|nr:STAS domain-containing protein [bacterium]